MNINKTTSKNDKTIIVLGSPRGGTSMIAGLLREFGIFMGDGLGKNHEDPKFLGNDINTIETTIKERNEKYNVWGWKVPHTIFYIDKIEHLLTNPSYIIVYRNIHKVAESQIRHSNADKISALKVTTNYYAKIMEFIEKSKAPILVINYESLVQNKISGIETLSNFLKIQLTAQTLDNCIRFIDPDKGYKQVSFNNFSIDKIQDFNRQDFIQLKPFELKLTNSEIINNTIIRTNELNPHIELNNRYEEIIIVINNLSPSDLLIEIKPGFNNKYSQNIKETFTILSGNTNLFQLQSKHAESFLIVILSKTINQYNFNAYVKEPNGYHSIDEILDNEPHTISPTSYNTTLAIAKKLSIKTNDKLIGQIRSEITKYILKTPENLIGLKSYTVPDHIYSVGPKVTIGSLDLLDLFDEIINLYTKEDLIKNVLDFGCSNGRLCSIGSSYLSQYNWYGCDAREETIKWTTENIIGVDFFVNPEVPPIDSIKNNLFGIIIAISIWSHFSPKRSIAWFNEANRILKPGGLLVFSTHGYRSLYHLSKFKNQNKNMANLRLKALNNNNIHFSPYPKSSSISDDLDTDNWGITFMSKGWIKEKTKDKFEIIDILPGRILKNQDLYILKKI